jgi:4-alpha-glucanotransferase
MVPSVCTPEIVHAVVRQHLASPSILCILPLQVRPTCWVVDAVCRAACLFYHPCGAVSPARRRGVTLWFCEASLCLDVLMCQNGWFHSEILVLQDWLALSSHYYTRPATEEAINDPTNKRHYWRWRMEPFVESLLEDHELLMSIQNLNLKTGRTMLHELKE